MLVEFFISHLRGCFPLGFHHYPHKSRMDQFFKVDIVTNDSIPIAFLLQKSQQSSIPQPFISLLVQSSTLFASHVINYQTALKPTAVVSLQLERVTSPSTN